MQCILITVFPPFSPPIPIPHLPSYPLIYRYQQSIAYQVEVELSSSFCVRAWQDNQAWEIGPQKLTQVPGTGTDPTPRGPKNRPSYTTVMHTQRA